MLLIADCIEYFEHHKSLTLHGSSEIYEYLEIRFEI